MSMSPQDIATALLAIKAGGAVGRHIVEALTAGKSVSMQDIAREFAEKGKVNADIRQDLADSDVDLPDMETDSED